MYLNVYVPTLQRVLGVAGFFREQRGVTFASSAPMTTALVNARASGARLRRARQVR